MVTVEAQALPLSVSETSTEGFVGCLECKNTLLEKKKKSIIENIQTELRSQAQMCHFLLCVDGGNEMKKA